MRQTRAYTYLDSTCGLCRSCGQLVTARVLAQDDAVYQERLCPRCGSARVKIAESVDWYLRVTRQGVHCRPHAADVAPVRRGCPWDCGPCAFHANACRLPVISITNVCNLRCPICFTYNRPDRAYFMSRDALARAVDRAVEQSGALDLVNITGGEPTQHPDLLSLLQTCRRPEIGRVTVNSNGLRLAEDESLCASMAELGVYVVLSLHTLRPERSRLIHGADVVQAKRKALENLQRHGVGTTLLHVMVGGVNDDEAGDLIALARTHSVVRSVTVQTMTFTGAGGGRFAPRQHIPLDGAARRIEEATAGAMRREHFFPHASAHPLCYSVAYYLKGPDRMWSLTDLVDVATLRRMLAEGYLLRPDAAPDALKSALDRLWAENGDAALLRDLKMLIGRLYPPEHPMTAADRQHVAEEQFLTVYLHAHMDEDTFDLSRLVVCPDQVADPDGRLTPACAYNLFYRKQDERFYAAEPSHAPV